MANKDKQPTQTQQQDAVKKNDAAVKRQDNKSQDMSNGVNDATSGRGRQSAQSSAKKH